MAIDVSDSTFEQEVLKSSEPVLVDFFAENPSPDESEVKIALSGNLCRCTGYQNIIVAAMDGAARLRLEKDSDDDIHR